MESLKPKKTENESSINKAKKLNDPKISVIMAVYNGERFLRQTMESIISQSFTSFEVIAVDDASTDNTPYILKEYALKDNRVKIYRNEKNMRLANSLNKAAELAKGKYILRMDADDICLKDRFLKQYEYMEKNPKTDLSFCKFFALTENGIIPSAVSRKCDEESIKAMFLFFCPVLHPGVIVKASFFKKYKYDFLHTCSEDLDLWIRMLTDGAVFTCSGEYLLLYRMHKNSITAKTKEKQKEEVLLSERIFYNHFLLGLPKEKEEFYINGVYFKDECNLKQLYLFYKYIKKANKKKKLFNKKAVITALAEVLAEYKRNFNLNIFKKLSFLRFGGIRLAAEFIQKKKRTCLDIEAAKAAAAKEKFKYKNNSGKLPIYYSEYGEN